MHCTKCGKIGHNVATCKEVTSDQETGQLKKKQWPMSINTIFIPNFLPFFTNTLPFTQGLKKKIIEKSGVSGFRNRIVAGATATTTNTSS